MYTTNWWTRYARWKDIFENSNLSDLAKAYNTVIQSCVPNSTQHSFLLTEKHKYLN